MNGKSLLLTNNLLTENKVISAVKSLFSKNIKSFLLFCVLSTSTLSFAQIVGPAGVSSGIRLWLDASDLDGDGIVEGIGESGIVIGLDTNVVEWRDKSGVLPLGSAHFTSPTPSLLFTDSAKYKLLESDFNGRTAVEFGPTSALYHELLAPWSGAGTHTVFIVFKQKVASVPSGTSLFSSGIDTVNTPAIDEHFQISSDSLAGTHFAYYTTSGGVTPTATENNFGLQTAAVGAPTFYSATRSATDAVTYLNGVLVSTVPFSADGNVFDQYLLNANRDTSLINDCYIAEVIIYDVVLFGTELQRVHDYLYCKYITAFADTMPGGIDPCSVSLWLKADGAGSTNLTGGGDVDDWYDQSNYSFHGDVSGGAVTKPSYVPSDNNFNPSINFDGNDRLTLGATGLSPASVADFDALTMGINDFSIYAVAKHDPGSGGTLFADNYCDESNGYRLNYSSSAMKWRFDGLVVDNMNVTLTSANPETDTTETPYALLKFNRVGTQHTIQTNEGDVNVAASSPTLSLSANNDPTERWLGRRSDQGSCGPSHFDGNLSEIIIVRSAVSVEEDKKIQSYLGIKYGLTAPSSMVNYLASDGVTNLWTFSSHWNDVAGIGQDDGSLLHQRIGKSQHPTGIVTMSTEAADFTSVNDGNRVPMGDGNFLVWGNNNTPATAAWAVGSAPVDYAILPEIWRVKKTGTSHPAMHLQVDVNDLENDMPGFIGDLYLVHGPDISMAVPLLMTETAPGSGLWTRSNVNFSDSSYFTFAVKNDLSIEFSYPASASVNEQLMDTFPDVLATGIVNVASSFDVDVVGGSANNSATGPDYAYTNLTYSVDTGAYVLDTFPLTPPTLGVINQDLIDEGLETALFQINVGTGIAIGNVDGVYSALQVHTFTITDDDSYQIEIGGPVDGIENVAPSPATFVISMAGGVTNNTSGADITGTITYLGTATNGVDYTTQNTFTLAMNAPSVTITLPVIDDALLEGSETIIATIATSVGAIALTAPATANISDDEETTSEVSIGSPVNINEGLGSVEFTVSLGTTNQTGVPITGDIIYAIGVGNAIDGTDFTGAATWSIANGASSGSVTSSTTSDQLVEDTEPVIAIISNPSIGGVHSTFFTDTAYIYDEDTTALQISLSSGVTTVVEGVGVTIDYLVELDGMKTNGTGGDITGTVTLTGTAFPGTAPFPDYSNNASFPFAIPDGFGSTIVTINVTNDGSIEPPKTVIATISGLSVGTPGAGSAGVTVTILDDDAGTAFISIGSPTDTTEAPAVMGQLPYVSYVVFIEGGTLNTSGAAITGNIIYSGTATPLLDFTAVPTYSIDIGFNSDTIKVPVINNGATEPPETLTAILSGVPSSGGSYANTTSTANIFDDDAANLTISVGSPLDGAEAGADALFVVSLDGGLPNGSGSPIFGTIGYSGAAVASTDFVAPPVTFSIADGELTDTIFLSVIDDQIVEYTEDIVVVISSPSVGGISATNNTVVVSIADNDVGGLLLSIDTPVDGTEGGGDVSFLISMNGGALTNGLGVPLTGTVSFTGTATSSFDFVNTTTFSIPDGASSEPLVLSVLDDLSIEPTDTIIATISAPLLGNIGALATDTAVIFDNDTIITLNIEAVVQGVEFPSPSATDPQFRVSLGGGLINELGTNITGDITLGGTAVDGADYTGVGSFIIANTNGEEIITMPIIDDFLGEPTETIIATISSPSIGVIGILDMATANIYDDDTDSDHDGLVDLLDSNDINIDTDCDGIFDGCDADHDGDGMTDAGLDDYDGDGICDACDASITGGGIDNGPDINGDGLNDVEWDPTDDDGDLLPNHVDPNDTNTDTDGDGISDGADADVNGDGILDNGCDLDGDGIHNVADSDDSPTDSITDIGNLDSDGDGIDNDWDPFPDDGGPKLINYIVSPNGDGVNETLRITGIEFFDRHELIIFNRWGAPVYKSTNYKNDWVGQISELDITGSEMLMEGTYFYTLDLGIDVEFVRGFIEIRK